MNIEGVFVAFSTAAAGSGFFYWLLRRSFDSRFRELEAKVEAQAKEQGRRSGKVFDKYFEAVMESAQLMHRLGHNLMAYCDMAEQMEVKGQLGQDRVAEISRWVEHARSNVSRMHDTMATATLLMPLEIREARRQFEQSFEQFLLQYDSWRADLKTTLPSNLECRKSLSDLTSKFDVIRKSMNELLDV